MKTFRVVYLICATLLMMLGCKKNQSENTHANQTAAVVPVEVSTIRQGDISVTIDVVGQSEALRKEIVLSPVAGTITSCKVLEGTAVQPGDLLAVVQTKESQAAIAGAKQLLAEATTPEQRREAERALELAKSSQNLVPIISKPSGIVSARSVVEGSLVAEGSELLTIVDPSSVGFVAQVPLKDLAAVKSGQSAQITFANFSSMIFNAIVVAMSPESAPQTQTVRVRLTFVDVSSEQRIYLKNGMAGTARIVTGTRANALLVPTRALLRNDENNTYTVVTVTSDSLSRSVPVMVGVVEDTFAEVSSESLQSGMSVVVAGHYSLADSTRVTIVTRKAP